MTDVEFLKEETVTHPVGNAAQVVTAQRKHQRNQSKRNIEATKNIYPYQLEL